MKEKELFTVAQKTLRRDAERAIELLVARFRKLLLGCSLLSAEDEKKSSSCVFDRPQHSSLDSGRQILEQY